MNWEDTHEYTRPEHPYKDTSTNEAYTALKAAYFEAVRQVENDPFLTSDEAWDQLYGIGVFARLAFARYGGIPWPE